MQRLRKYQTVASSDPPRYETWKLPHNCNLNYTGSSPQMEIERATKIFSSSKEKDGLYYPSFNGGGDSKTYPAVIDIYGSIKPIKKFECVGHYQKRVGSRLRNLKKKKTEKDREEKENLLILK